MKLIEKLLEAIAPVIEYNQQSMIQQLVNESAVMDDQKKISVITVLQRLRDERQSYVNIINKTRELIGKAQPVVPSVLIDELIDKLAENISSRRLDRGNYRRSCRLS
ncbi:GSCOCG00009683001-RA-CDS [Cotesia congregata]|nr:GSCOCG00009683001-RA-CDS [Cotesia congregata]